MTTTLDNRCQRQSNYVLSLTWTSAKSDHRGSSVGCKSRTVRTSQRKCHYKIFPDVDSRSHGIVSIEMNTYAIWRQNSPWCKWGTDVHTRHVWLSRGSCQAVAFLHHLCTPREVSTWNSTGCVTSLHGACKQGRSVGWTALSLEPVAVTSLLPQIRPTLRECANISARRVN